MKHKITMRDIARECGVSAATVSYVLNHSNKEKISHEMRLKVMETATRMHYIPSMRNKQTISRKSNLVGIVVNLHSENLSSKTLLYYDLAAKLSYELLKIDLESIVIVTKHFSEDIPTITKHNLDAIFFIDTDTALLQKATQNCYVPIIFLDCEFNDSLFCRIIPDYTYIIEKSRELLHEENPFLLMEDICCNTIRNKLSNLISPGDIFVHTSTDKLNQFLKLHKNQKGIILGDILGIQCSHFFPNNNLVILSSLDDSYISNCNMFVLKITNTQKAKLAVNILQDMLSLDYNAENGNRILLQPELLAI